MKTYFGAFLIPAIFFATPFAGEASISVGSGNDSGESASVVASDELPGPTELADGIFTRLPSPTIELRRWGQNSLDVKYQCAAPTFQDNSYVQLKILRQFADEEWEVVFTRSWPSAGEGTWTDNAAPIEKPVRYAAITTWMPNAASNAHPPEGLAYLPGKIGLNGIHVSSTELGALAPPGFYMTGEKADSYRLIISSHDGKSPAFYSLNPFFNVISATLDYAELRRFTNEPYTELSADGYFIRGKKFSVSYDVNVFGWPYATAVLRSEPANIEWTGGWGKSERINKTDYIRSYVTGMTGYIPLTSYKGEKTQGFDDATYFAAQHLGFGSRHVEVSAPEFEHSGPFDLEVVGGGIDLTSTSSVLNTGGSVTESLSQQKLKVVTVPSRHWTIGVYRTDIYDLATATMHPGTEPPDPLVLRDYLNEVFGKQANVTFAVIPKPPILIVATGWPGEYPYPVSAMKETLWNASDEDTDLAIFYVETLGPDTGGQAFGIPSRGAAIGPHTLRAAAHEIGHCLGLHHCWQPNADATGMDSVPDEEKHRLMGYKGGELLRSREIIRANTTIPINVLPLGQ